MGSHPADGLALPAGNAALRYTGRGRRRPRTPDGRYPVPWISPENGLGMMHPGRRADTIREKLCQVCGLPNDETVYFVAAGYFSTYKRLSTRRRMDSEWPPEGEGRPPFAALEIKDDAIMHESCARLAVGNCPELKQRRERGVLYMFACPLDAIESTRREMPEVTSEGVLEEKLIAKTSEWERWSVIHPKPARD